MQNQIPCAVPQVKDLGVIISKDLKFSRQCNEAVKKANMMLGFIKRNFTFKSKETILSLYKSLVRPHLEYAVQLWSPYLIKDIKKMEGVQRRATKLIPNLRNKFYNDRLSELDLFSLEKRRLRGQLIECFKIIKGFVNLDSGKLFTPSSNTRTRGHNEKLKGFKVDLDITQIFFTHKVVNEWNALPSEVVSRNSINAFKLKLDKHLKLAGVL